MISITKKMPSSISSYSPRSITSFPLNATLQDAKNNCWQDKTKGSGTNICGRRDKRNVVHPPPVLCPIHECDPTSRLMATAHRGGKISGRPDRGERREEEAGDGETRSCNVPLHPTMQSKGEGKKVEVCVLTLKEREHASQ